MLTSSTDANPFDAWTHCANSLAEASLVMVNTTLSMWGSALTPASAATPAPEPRRAALVVHEPRVPHVQVTDRAASWYRAPYRSPFDPLFWMEPDTSRSAFSTMPWMANFGMPNPATASAPSLWPWFGAAAKPSPQQATSMFAPQPGVPNFGAMSFGAFPADMSAMMPWLTPATNPLLSSWMAMVTKSVAAPAVPAPMSDPMSAYRSMGGFAVAQAFMDTATKAAPESTSAKNSWMDLAFPWLRH